MTKHVRTGQSNFKAYPPTLDCFDTTPQHLKGSQLDQQCVWAFCIWHFENQNELLETPVFHLDAYPILHRKTLTHILPFTGANCVISFMTFFNTASLTSVDLVEWITFAKKQILYTL